MWRYNPLLVVHAANSSEHIVVVSEWLAHAHHDHITQAFALGAQLSGEALRLLECFRRRQLSRESHFASGAEYTAHGASCL